MNQMKKKRGGGTKQEWSWRAEGLLGPLTLPCIATACHAPSPVAGLV